MDVLRLHFIRAIHVVENIPCWRTAEHIESCIISLFLTHSLLLPFIHYRLLSDNHITQQNGQGI